MSMNFAREQSLLRQKLQAKASPELAAARQQQLVGVTFLGAADAEVAAAAAALAATYPQMGRAQMTAFVRTLWSSKIHELRAVGVQLLAARAGLLEPADLPLLEGFLHDPADDVVRQQLARDVVGPLVGKHKKLWKDLKRFVGSGHAGLRLAGVNATARALQEDAEAFPRFADLVTPLLAVADAALQVAIDELLVFAAELHREAAAAFVQQHNRGVVLPKPRPTLVPAPAAAAPTPAPVATPAAVPVKTAKRAPKAPAAKPAPAKPPAPAGKPAGKATKRAPAAKPKASKARAR